jgi:hypothetical protein
MISAPARVQRLALFGPPFLLDGEDEAAYDELLARMCAAVKPANVIEEMFIADVVFLEWDILRWRRLRSSMLRASGHKVLEDFLSRTLDYPLYAEAFEETRARIKSLRAKLAEDEARKPGFHRPPEPDAAEKVDKYLTAEIRDLAKAETAKKLAQAYARREPDAMKQVDELLASNGLTIHDMMAEGLTKEIDGIEQIDRLLTIAETRRNVSLREIDRHRAVLGAALRRRMQEIEDGQFEIIETMPAGGKTRRDQ